VIERLHLGVHASSTCDGLFPRKSRTMPVTTSAADPCRLSLSGQHAELRPAQILEKHRRASHEVTTILPDPRASESSRCRG